MLPARIAAYLCTVLRVSHKIIDLTAGPWKVLHVPQILAVDYGTKRLGIAVSDLAQTYGLPLQVLETPPRARAAAVAQLASERDINTVVIGRPRRSHGEDSALWPDIEKFGEALERRGLRIVYEDEGFSSAEAESGMRTTGKLGRRRRVDAVAAKLILEQYLARRTDRADD